MTRFALNVEHKKPKAREPDCLPLLDQLVAELKERLPADAYCLAFDREGPEIVICHRGRPLGLHIRTGPLTAVQDCCFDRLRRSGMRIEMARNFPEAMRLVEEMGVALRPVVNPVHAARSFFREETRRR